MPEISIVVPVYNAENSIERCVQSICSQTFSDLELILVDDGSTDYSGELCDKFASADKRIQVVHKENGGVSSARNCGMDIATGEYLLFTDSDDYLPPDYCQRLLEEKYRGGERTIVWAALQVVSENHRIAEQKYCFDESPVSFLTRKDVLKLSMKYLINSPVNKLYDLQLIHENRLYMNEKISIAEDLLFNLQYLALFGDCKIIVLNDLTYFYVRNGMISLDHGYRQNYYGIHKDVLGRLWKYCETWQVPKEDYPLYYLRYWEYMQSALANNNMKQSGMGWFKRMHENSKILRDKAFQKALSYKKNTMGRGSYLTLRSGCYALVWLYEKL